MASASLNLDPPAMLPIATGDWNIRVHGVFGCFGVSQPPVYFLLGPGVPVFCLSASFTGFSSFAAVPPTPSANYDVLAANQRISARWAFHWEIVLRYSSAISFVWVENKRKISGHSWFRIGVCVSIVRKRRIREKWLWAEMWVVMWAEIWVVRLEPQEDFVNEGIVGVGTPSGDMPRSSIENSEGVGR
jgi:hypothetical protein